MLAKNLRVWLGPPPNSKLAVKHYAFRQVRYNMLVLLVLSEPHLQNDLRGKETMLEEVVPRKRSIPQPGATPT